MSLTSYRAAPPRVGGKGCGERVWGSVLGWPGGDLLSRALRRSTIGAEGFHGRVRDGIGCVAPRYDHQAIEEPLWKTRRVFHEPPTALRATKSGRGECEAEVFFERRRCQAGFAAVRGVGRLCPVARARRGNEPIERLGPVSCAHCCASTPGLSTWWSSTALGETWF